MPLGSASGPRSGPGQFAASTGSQSSSQTHVEICTQRVVSLGLAAKKACAEGRREEAASIFRAAADACLLGAEGTEEEVRNTFLLRRGQLLNDASRMLDPPEPLMRPAVPPPVVPPLVNLAPPAPPLPTPTPTPIRPASSQGPVPMATGVDTAAVNSPNLPPVKVPNSRFAFRDANYKECYTYVGGLAQDAEGIKATDAKKAIGLLTEAADLCAWFANRFAYLGVFDNFQLCGQNYAQEAERLQTNINNANPPAPAAHAANGAQSSATEAADMEGRVRACIINDPPNKRVEWKDVIGNEVAKNALLSVLIDPYVMAQNKDRPRSKGVLMFGPSGTGKTMLVKAAVNLAAKYRGLGVEGPTRSKQEPKDPKKDTKDAKDSKDAKAKKGITLFSVSAADVNSKWVGEAEKFIAKLFQVARQESPSVVFIDEVDALLSQRDSGNNASGHAAKNQFLVETDGLCSDGADVVLLTSSNYPWMIDGGMTRRLGKSVEVGLPDLAGRVAILKHKLKGMKCPYTVTDAQLEELAGSKTMEKFSGANIEQMVKNAYEGGPQARIHDALWFVERDDGKLWCCDEGTPGARRGPFLTLLDDYYHEGRGLPDFGEEALTYDDLRMASKTVVVRYDMLAALERYKKSQEDQRV